jgi:hypothetical protein
MNVLIAPWGRLLNRLQAKENAMILNLIDRLAGRWIDFRIEQAATKNPGIGEFKLKKVEFDENGFHMIASFPGVVMIADEAAAMLDANDARSYVEFDMMPRLDRGKRPIRITVQWAWAESPAAKAARLERELEILTAALDAGDATPLLQRCLAALRFVGTEIEQTASKPEKATPDLGVDEGAKS